MPQAIEMIEESPKRTALALAAVGGPSPEAKQRVRVAADTAASPRLRVALSRIADDADEEALAEAFARLEEQR